MLNAESSLQPANVLAALLLILLITRLAGADVLTVSFISCTSFSWLWALVLLPFNFSKFSFLHSLLHLFTLLNLTLCDSTLFHWGISSPHGYILVSTSLEFVACVSAVPDCGITEVGKCWSNFSGLTSIN